MLVRAFDADLRGEIERDIGLRFTELLAGFLLAEVVGRERQ
jgi:hypothetical protein